jgi:hypothetical protein
MRVVEMDRPCARAWLSALFVGACTAAFLAIAGCAAAYLFNLVL